MKKGSQFSLRRISVLFLSLILVLSISACAMSEYRNDTSAPGQGINTDDQSSGVKDEDGGGGDEASLDLDRKIITDTDIRMESTDVPLAIRELADLARKQGGYIQSQYQSESSGSNYYGELIVRIPADTVDAFIAKIEDHGKIRENKVSVQDVTADYTDTASRLANARVQEERLLELFAEANTIDEMLYIQTELDRLQERIEVYEGQIRLWDNLIDLATISIQLYTDSSLLGTDRDVPRYIPADTVWQQFKIGLNSSVVNFVNGVSRSVIWVGENFIQALFFLILLVILLLIIRRGRKNRKLRPAHTANYNPVHPQAYVRPANPQMRYPDQAEAMPQEPVHPNSPYTDTTAEATEHRNPENTEH